VIQLEPYSDVESYLGVVPRQAGVLYSSSRLFAFLIVFVLMFVLVFDNRLLNGLPLLREILTAEVMNRQIGGIDAAQVGMGMGGPPTQSQYLGRVDPRVVGRVKVVLLVVENGSREVRRVALRGDGLPLWEVIWSEVGGPTVSLVSACLWSRTNWKAATNRSFASGALGSTWLLTLFQSSVSRMRWRLYVNFAGSLMRLMTGYVARREWSCVLRRPVRVFAIGVADLLAFAARLPLRFAGSIFCCGRFFVV
jgi:hypothetical protein